jgi:hypothetical protein
MSGMAIARAFFLEHGLPMIQERFAAFAGRMAAGLAGEGSECFGFDDAHSRDHDFGAGFCIWLDDDAYEEAGLRLDEAYHQLPGAYRGLALRKTHVHGAQRTGVMRASDFYQRFLGCPGIPTSCMEWLRIPESNLAVATNGEVFFGDGGEFVTVREGLIGFYPDEVRLVLIKRRLTTMAQAGQYNYPRCMRRGEKVGAFLALSEFAKAACSVVYLLNRRYMPFYKWAHRGMADLALLGSVRGLLASMTDEPMGEGTEQAIEAICASVASELKSQGITSVDASFLLNHAESIHC